MPNVYAAILELFGSLHSDERKELAEQLYFSSHNATFYEFMSAAQRRHLHEAIARPDRHEPAELASVTLARLGRELPIIVA